MIERGGGRTSGLTDWRLMDVFSMWACLQDQDTTGQWKQVAGWRKVGDLALAHLGRLQEYRRGLADAWPPETNAAARAYLGELDQLIDKVQRTHDTAAVNYDALAAATRAIGSTRAELKPIYDEYAAKLQQKRAYEAILADPKAVAGSRLPDQPPVTDGELEQLNIRARGLMTGLSDELQQAQVMLRQPPPPLRPGRQTNDPDAYAGTTQGPTIPPIVAVPIGLPDTPMAVRPKTALPEANALSKDRATGSGPVLGGVNSPLPSVTRQPPNAPPTTGVTRVAPPLTFPAIPQVGKLPAGQFTGQPNLPGHSLREVQDHATRPAAPSGPRPTPPSGLIGNAPGLAPSQPSSATTPRRINPIGGVIGGGGAGTAPGGGAGSRPGGGRPAHLSAAHGPVSFGGSPLSDVHRSRGRPASHEREVDGPRAWDPNNPWETDQGVNPVVLPPEERGPIDPGPAIGFDR